MPDDDGPPQVPVVCSECGTRASVPLPDVAESIERHNDAHHESEEVARVDPDLADRIADLVADELGLLGE